MFNINKMKNNHFRLLLLSITIMLTVFGQAQTTTKEKKKNLTIKEWNTNVGSKTPFLDHVTTYNPQGKKIEEIEYASYGMKSRITYEYGTDGKCSREVEYNDHNKVVRIKKYEYYSDGTKKKQYNYSPNGKLESSKSFEYIYK